MARGSDCVRWHSGTHTHKIFVRTARRECVCVVCACVRACNYKYVQKYFYESGFFGL